MIAGSTYRIEHCPRCHSEERLRAYARRAPRRESPSAGQLERWQELLRFSFESGSFLKPFPFRRRAGWRLFDFQHLPCNAGDRGFSRCFLQPRAHMARARDAGFVLGMLFHLAAGFCDAFDACPLDRRDRGLDRDFILLRESDDVVEDASADAGASVLPQGFEAFPHVVLDQQIFLLFADVAKALKKAGRSFIPKIADEGRPHSRCDVLDVEVAVISPFGDTAPLRLHRQASMWAVTHRFLSMSEV